jgi:small conductance mechanosensitive channel
VIVPNGKLYADNIVNFNALGQRRVDLVFGVSYNTDINKAKAVFAEELSKDSRILESPAATIGLLELADSSINFAVRPWVHADHYWPVFYGLQESIKQRLDAEGIAIPFPQQDVHIVRE